MISDNIYQQRFDLHTHHTDPYLRARMPFYCRAIQEGAARHALLCGCANEDLERQGKSWVLSRFRLEISRYLDWPSSFSLQTWIQEPFRFFAPREARGVDDAGAELFRSMAYWVIIDLAKRRPVRSDALTNYISLSENRSLWSKTVLEKLPAVESGPEASISTPQIMYRDIDSVRHINNIAYIEWILDSFPADHHAEFLPGEFEINFLSECFPEDTLQVTTTAAPDDESACSWLHRIEKLRTGKSPVEVCRARSRWRVR